MISRSRKAPRQAATGAARGRAGHRPSAPRQHPQAVVPATGLRAPIAVHPIRAPYVPVRRGILVLDIDGFGGADQTDAGRVQLRAALHWPVDQALTTAGIGGRQVVTRADLGDGILVLTTAEVAPARLIGALLTELAGRLVAMNRAGLGGQRLRLRAVVHTGKVLRDRYGHTGSALNHAFRLLDGAPVRAVLHDRAIELAVALSDEVFDAV